MKTLIRKALVAGAGKSGIAAAKLLLCSGSEVLLYDGNENADAEKILVSFPEKKPVLQLGSLGNDWKNCEICVISPGIPLTAPFVPEVQAAGIPIWSEIELAYRLGSGKLAAITGTNGKTTTTALTGEMLAKEYAESFVVGNIGIPYTQEAIHMTADCATVAEISSFQLETIVNFHPEVSAILNITPDHLNRHGTMENYVAVKESITRNQTAGDVCVLNYEDPYLKEFAGRCPARVLFFSSLHELPEGLFLRGDEIMFRHGSEEEDVINVHELNIVGRHNHENAMAAIGIAFSMGVSMDHIREALKAFKAVEHRIEFVLERDGVVYYNDSKGTNPDAAIKGIEAMSRPTYLIGGGYDKKSDYTEWLMACRGRIRKLVLLGQTAEAIKACAEKVGVGPVVIVSSMREAVELCRKEAKPGEAVLLSPACASWGMFDNYEQRGRIFKDLVREN